MIMSCASLWYPQCQTQTYREGAEETYVSDTSVWHQQKGTTIENSGTTWTEGVEGERAQIH